MKRFFSTTAVLLALLLCIILSGCGEEALPPASGSVKRKRLRLSPSSELIHRKKMCPKSLAKGVGTPRVVVQDKNEVWASVAGKPVIN